MADVLTLFYILVGVVVLLAIAFHVVPFIFYLQQRRYEEALIVGHAKDGGKEIDPIELSTAFHLLKTSTTPVTRSTLALLPTVIVGIAILYLITSNLDMVLTSMQTNTSITANSTISNTVTTSNSLINTLLGVFAGFLTAASGFYFAAKTAESSSETDGDTSSEALLKLQKELSEEKLERKKVNEALQELQNKVSEKLK
jgi:hypothetical protein